MLHGSIGVAKEAEMRRVEMAALAPAAEQRPVLPALPSQLQVPGSVSLPVQKLSFNARLAALQGALKIITVEARAESERQAVEAAAARERAALAARAAARREREAAVKLRKAEISAAVDERNQVDARGWRWWGGSTLAGCSYMRMARTATDELTVRQTYFCVFSAHLYVVRPLAF